MLLSLPTRVAEWSDPWMVRVTLTGAADVERWTAVDLAPDDPTPGVYPMLLERGSLRGDAANGWHAVRNEIRAWNELDAFGAASAVYDAARGFSELRLPTDTGTVPTWAPHQLRIEIGDTSWTFDPASAPAAAWAVLAAARTMG